MPVPIFRKPTIQLAQRTLTAIIAILIVLLAESRTSAAPYGISATKPGADGYQSVLSMLIAAVFWARRVVLRHDPRRDRRGARAVRQHELRGFSRGSVASRRGSLSPGLVTRSMVDGSCILDTGSSLLAITGRCACSSAFGGITDNLIPLFAIGAFLAFTLSQAGMVVHWKNVGGPHARRFMVVNGAGAIATGITLVVVTVSKFSDGAWLTVVVDASARPVLLG